MTLPVLVVGASVAGATAANTLAMAGVPVVLLEKDLKRVKPCGGAVPPVAFSEFDIPESLIARKVHRTVIHSPSDRQADIPVAGSNPTDNDHVAMVLREVFDPWLRQRAVTNGARLVEGAFQSLQVDADGVTVTYRPKAGGSETDRFSAVIGADGAYSPVALALGLPNLPRCTAMQERIRLPDGKMARWDDCADLYLGVEVSPDLYAWAFPKADHVAVGVGVGPKHAKQIKALLANLKARIAPDLEGGDSILTEAHALPMEPRPTIAFDRVMLAGDAAGLVVGASGEGIYWAMKSGHLAAEVLAESLPNPTAARLARYQQRWWKAYGSMYRFLRFLQRWGYASPRQMEVFTDMCRNRDVQRLTFDSYLYKEMAPAPWLAQLTMTRDIVAAQVRHYLPFGRQVATARMAEAR